MFEECRVIIIGNNIAISTSKIKKITAIRKNRNEKGNRADLFGSKPHSKGDDFSRSSIIFFDSSVANIIINMDSIIVNVVIIIMINIIYFVLTNFLIGSQIYLIY